MTGGVVTIRVVQRDGCGFEVSEAANVNAIPTEDPEREAARLLLVALGRALRCLGPSAQAVIEDLGDLVRQFGDSDGEP